MAWMTICACGGTEPGPDQETGASGDEVSATGQGETTGSTDSEDAEDDTAADTTGAGPVPLPTTCECRVPQADGLSCQDLARTECEGRALCPLIRGTCPRPPDLYPCDRELEYVPADLQCALEALRDRALGKISIDVPNSECGLEGCGADTTEIAIVAGGTAIVRDCNANPITAQGSTSSIRTLAEPDYFDECLGQVSGVAQLDCLFAGLSDEVVVCR